MFDAAIEAFLQVGNVAQLTITLASATALFERIDRLDAAATLHDAVARLPGSAHHVPDLPELAVRLEVTRCRGVPAHTVPRAPGWAWAMRRCSPDSRSSGLVTSCAY